MINMINLAILLISVLISIAFFTLMERKIISYSQNRKGPNKVGMIGLLQPITDAIKLMSKEMNMNIKSNFITYLLSPILNIICSMIMWMAMPLIFNFSFMKMSIIFIISCTSFNTMSIMMMSWSSNSNYSFIGMMRTIAQMISYEINLMLILLTMINMTEQMNLNLMDKLQKYAPMAAIVPPLFAMWMITVLAETNRTPFDFSEGESELISGFNIEYSSNSFMLLFLAEYSSILMMSMITSIMFITSMKSLAFIMAYMAVCVIFIWTRTTFPRFRYDKLMSLNWTQLLPSTTFLLMISFTIKMYYTKKIKNLHPKMAKMHSIKKMFNTKKNQKFTPQDSQNALN